MSLRNDLIIYKHVIEKKSYGIIAKEMNISRNIVAGVIWRSRYLPRDRKYSNKGRKGSNWKSENHLKYGEENRSGKIK